MKKRILAWILVVAMCITTFVTPEMYFASDAVEKAELETKVEVPLSEKLIDSEGRVLSYREGPELDTRWSKEDIKNASRPIYGVLPASYSSTDALKGIYSFEVVLTAMTTDGSNLSVSCMINVVEAPVYVDYMEITYEGEAIDEFITDVIGATYELGVIITPSNANIQEVVWTSSNDEVVTVDKNGVITIIGIGEAFVTAYSTDGSGVNTSIPVTVNPVYVTDIDFDIDYLDIEVGESYTVQAIVFPENADNKGLVWESLDSDVVTVDQNGKVTGVMAGEAMIRIKSADGMVTRYLRVSVNPISIKNITILCDGEETTEYIIEEIGTYLQLNAKIEPENAASKAFTWNSSNTSVATIDANGLVEAVGAGVTIITAAAMDGSGVEDSLTLYVDKNTLGYTTFAVEHYVMNTNGEYVLTETEYIEAFTSDIFVADDLMNEKYDNEETTYFSSMLEDGYEITMFLPKANDASVIEMYYKRVQKDLSVFIAFDSGEEFWVANDTLFVESQVNLKTDYLMECVGKEVSRIEIYDIVVEPGNLETQYIDGVLSFQMPISSNVEITYKVREKITYTIEHYVMNAEGDYVLAQTDTCGEYVSEEHSSQEFIKDEYNDGKINYYVCTAVDNVIVDTFILSNNSIVKVYYDRKIYDVIIDLDICGEKERIWEEEFFAEQNIGEAIDGNLYFDSNKYEIVNIEISPKDADVTIQYGNIYIGAMPGANLFITVFVEKKAEDVVIPNGWNQAEDGNWYYYKDGDVDVTANGLVYNETEDAWWYAVEGKADFTYTGLCEYYGGWYYVENGIVNWGYTGLTCYYGTWYYVEGGILNWGYTGLTCYYDTWYYVEGGVLNWNYTGLTCYYDTWYYVEGGILNWNYTGLTCYYDTWYYVEGGVLNWGYTGLTCYYDTWYYVEGGVLNWSYTGLCEYYGGWYYVEGGVLNWNYKGLCEYYGAWYYIGNGVLDWNFTGIVWYNGVLWYVENGIMVRAV